MENWEFMETMGNMVPFGKFEYHALKHRLDLSVFEYQ